MVIIQTENTNKLRLETPIWSLNDIMEYANVSKTTASKIRSIAIKKFKGLVPAIPSKTKRDAVLKALGLNYDDEIQKIRMLEE